MAAGTIYINFKNKNITTSPVKIDGIYEALESNHRNAIRLTNVVVNGVERADCMASATVVGTDYHLYYDNTDYISVTKEDMVQLVSI